MKTIPIKQIPSIAKLIDYHIENGSEIKHKLPSLELFLEKQMIVPSDIPKWKLYQAQVTSISINDNNVTLYINHIPRMTFSFPIAFNII